MVNKQEGSVAIVSQLKLMTFNLNGSVSNATHQHEHDLQQRCMLAQRIVRLAARVLEVFEVV